MTGPRPGQVPRGGREPQPGLADSGARPGRSRGSAARRGGVSNAGVAPREEGPADLRLVPPALAVWAAAALALCVPGMWALVGAGCCAAAAVALLPALRAGASGRRSHGLLVSACLVLLSTAAGGGVAASYAADLHRGPVPRLAKRQAEAAVELTVTSDPRRLRPRVHGARQSSGAVLFRAEVTRVLARPDAAPAVPDAANGAAGRTSCPDRTGAPSTSPLHRIRAGVAAGGPRLSGSRDSAAGSALGTTDLCYGPRPPAQHTGGTRTATGTDPGTGVLSGPALASHAIHPTPALDSVPASDPVPASDSGPELGSGPDSDRAVRTPVLVIVQRRDGPPTADWLRLLPSTGLRLEAHLGTPARTRPAEDVAAVLHARIDGPPETVRRASTSQRAAGVLRAGLRRASAGLGDDARGLLPGLVVGDTSRLPADLDAAFRSTDMTHLLAVSGANLTILLAVLIGPAGLAQGVRRRGLAGRLGIPLRATAVLGGLITLGFVFVCRPDPSVLRAAACGLVALLALATGRRRSLLPALAAAVMALVLYDPWLALDVGFALSVLATGALLTLAPRLSSALRRRRVPVRLAEALAAAAAAQIVCAPVVVVLAAHVSLVAVPCNLLAEFAVAPATVLGFAALIVSPFAMPLAEALAWLASWPTRCIAAIARTGAGLPGAEIGWPGGAVGSVLLALCTVTAVFAVVRLRLLRRPWLCAACVLLLLLAVLRPAPLVRPFTGWPPRHWRMVACDVGQGDGLVLSTGRAHTAVVVDTGPDPRAMDRCLRTLGITSIPLLLLTHFHADHVAGLPGALKGRSVGAVQTTGLRQPPGQAEFVRRTTRKAGVRTIGADTGERRRVGELSWQVLWPPAPGLGSAEQPEDPNDASITLLVHTAGLTLLLPGDLEPEAQQRLLTDNPGLPRVDVLKVAHHGSAHQSSELLRRLHPRIAVISCGADNPYGHPSPRTLSAVREVGALVSRTDRNGALAVTSAGPGSGGEDADRTAGAPPSLVTERAASQLSGSGTVGRTGTASSARTGTPPRELSPAQAIRRSWRREPPERREHNATALGGRRTRSPPATARPPRRPRPPAPRAPPAGERSSLRAVRPVPRPPPLPRRARAGPGCVAARQSRSYSPRALERRRNASPCGRCTSRASP